MDANANDESDEKGDYSSISIAQTKSHLKRDFLVVDDVGDDDGCTATDAQVGEYQDWVLLVLT